MDQRSDTATIELRSEAGLALFDLVKSGTAKVGVIGLGYVGVPLALAAARASYSVIGFDVNPDRVNALNQGRSGLRHIGSEQVEEAVAAGSFVATTDFAALPECDAIIICVPTPLTRHREPDLSYIVNTGKVIAEHLRLGQVVVLESTTYPGTTEEVLRPVLEESGLICGQDFFLGFSPEREDPGNPDFGTRSIPKVVGADNDDALAICVALYEKLVIKAVPVSSAATAEAVKITENIFRAVNIALVNELKVIYSSMGVDIWEVVDAAKTKPFGFMPFYPGPGLGGHCIPIDPFYLTWKAREFDVPTRFIELAGEINTRMPYHIVDQVGRALDRSGKSLNGAKILVLGLAYKKNIDDIRESPSLKIMELLIERQASVSFFDPFVQKIPSTREHMQLAGMNGAASVDVGLEDCDLCLILTDHDAVDYEAVSSRATCIVDTRNAMAQRGYPGHNVLKA